MLSALALTACGQAAATAPTADAQQTEEAAPEKVEILHTTETPDINGYNLLWSDEFDGPIIDDTKWTYEQREPGWTNNELQEYTDSTDNIFVRDGKAVIKAIKTTKDGKDYYTSGKLNSQNKQDFMYGKVVVSAKVPEGQGLWPAIWMMPQDESYYGQWPKCGEIDIMEVLGNAVDTAYCTVHYGEPHAEQQGIYTIEDTDKDGTFASGFHKYSVEWEPGEMRWYIDNRPVLTVNDWFTAVDGEDEKEFPAPFNQPFFVQMNLAVGGTWPGNPDETTNFDNAEFEIDYVRVYQKDEYDTNVKKPEVNFREPLEDGNYIINGDFSEEEDLDDSKIWSFLLFNGGKGEAKIQDNTLVISSTECGTEEYSVQMVQADIPVIKGKHYRVTFDAKADADRDIVVAVTAPTSGWVRYLEDTAVDITTDWETYTFDYTSDKKHDPNGRLEFNMGNHGYTDTVYIKNVRVEEVAD